MDKKTNEIVSLLKKYITELEKNNIPIKSAFLFGSYAIGKYDEWSDIDIAIVSDYFEGERFKDKEKIRRLTLRFNSNISPMPFKTEDFNESNLFVKEIIDEGIKIPL